MSAAAAADVLDYDAASATAPRPADPAPAPTSAPTPAPRFGFIRKNAPALMDQALISGANFVTGVITLRALGKDEVGAFSVIYGGLLFANILQSTLVTQAHNVIGATRGSTDDYRRYTTSTAVSQLLLGALQVLLVLPLTIFAYARGWSAAPMLLAVLPAIFFWQLQEFARRVMYTEMRHGRAFLNDCVAYGGQTIVLVALYASHQLQGTPFTGDMVFHVLAIASAAAAVFGFFQLRGSLTRAFDLKDVKENLHFGKWLAGGELMGWCSSLHMQIWWAALILGAAASADLRAAMILFGPARVISFFLSTVLPTRFARTLAVGGAKALRVRVVQAYLLLAPGVGLYCLILILLAGDVLHLIYGPEYAAARTARTVLMLYSVAAFFQYMQLVLAAALTAARQTHLIFAGSVCGCVMALIASPLLIKTFGSNGAMLSMIATTLAVGVLYVVAYVTRVRDAGETRGFEVIPGRQEVAATEVSA